VEAGKLRQPVFPDIKHCYSHTLSLKALPVELFEDGPQLWRGARGIACPTVASAQKALNLKVFIMISPPALEDVLCNLLLPGR
jgi:hypothetical protein